MAKVIVQNNRQSAASERMLLKIYLPIIGIASLFIVWSVIAASGLVRAQFLPGPLDVVNEIFVLMQKPYAGSLLQTHLVASLYKFGAAFVLGAVIGIPVGLIMGRFNLAENIIGPVFEGLRFVPPIAWVPFSILWFGTGFMSPVLVIFTGVFSSCVINSYAGVKQTEKSLLEAAQMLGTSKVKTITDVLIPASLPQIIAGLRIGAGFGWQSLIGAELIVGTTGLGYMIIQGESNLNADVVMAGMVVIGIVGTLIDAIMRWAEHHVRSKWA